MLKVPTDDPELLSTGLEILSEWAGRIAFEDDEIDKERGVVLEEWRLGRGAEARMRDQQFPVLFQGSRYAERLPIGEPEIIESASYEAVRRFYRDWYRPELMAVVAVGDFDPESVEAEIRRRFSTLAAPDEPRVREDAAVPDHDETLVSIASDPEATITLVSAYTKLPKAPSGSVSDVRRGIVESLYHTMVNARLQEVAQRAEPPFVFASSAAGSFVRPLDAHYRFAVAREGDVETALGALLTETERVAQHGFSQTELERAKSDLLRSYEQAFEERDKRESASYAAELRRHFLEGEPSPRNRDRAGAGATLSSPRSTCPTSTRSPASGTSVAIGSSCSAARRPSSRAIPTRASCSRCSRTPTAPLSSRGSTGFATPPW